MLEIRANHYEAEISGTADELRAVEAAIRRFVSGNARSMTMPAASLDPSPYTRSLSAFVLERNANPTLVFVRGDSVVVAGSEQSLGKFASWFSLEPEPRAGQHAHFEPQPGDAFHSSDSMAVVVMVRDPGT